MRGPRLVRHDREHRPEGGVLCRWQPAVDVAGQPGARWSVRGVWRPSAGIEAFVEELAQASATSAAQQAQQRREHLAGKYRLRYPAGLVPALKAKYGLKLIGEQQPSGRLEAARIGTARPWRTGLARCASPGRAGVSAARSA
jgi:hypothetical protein